MAEQLQNPFKPTAGKMPPQLIGRTEVLDEFYDGLANGGGAPERLVRVGGIRGMGKTVMLEEFGRMARRFDKNWTVISATATPGFTERIAKALRRGDALKEIHVSPSVLGVSLGGVDWERGAQGLRDVLDEATRRDRSLLVTLDEVQDAPLEELRQLATAMQELITADRNVAFAFAGLPEATEAVVRAKGMTFLQRANIVLLDRLDEGDVRDSLATTFRSVGGMSVADELIDLMAQSAQGFPFMVQLVGYHSWQEAYRRMGRKAGVMVEDDVAAGVAKARRRFETTVIEQALKPLSAAARGYLEALASLGGCGETSQVAAMMGKEQTALASTRARLIKEGLVEAPRRGWVSLAVPYMREYLVARQEADA